MSASNPNGPRREGFDPAESLADLRHEFGEHGGVNMSIEASTTFTVLEPELLPRLFQGQLGPESGGFYLYGRHYNPTVYVLGRELAALEGTPAAYCTASGMSAVSAAVLQCCDQGDHVVASDALYGGTFALFHDFLPRKAGSDDHVRPLDRSRRASKPPSRIARGCCTSSRFRIRP